MNQRAMVGFTHHVGRPLFVINFASLEACWSNSWTLDHETHPKSFRNDRLRLYFSIFFFTLDRFTETPRLILLRFFSVPRRVLLNGPRSIVISLPMPGPVLSDVTEFFYWVLRRGAAAGLVCGGYQNKASGIAAVVARLAANKRFLDARKSPPANQQSDESAKEKRGKKEITERERKVERITEQKKGLGRAFFSFFLPSS